MRDTSGLRSRWVVASAILVGAIALTGTFYLPRGGADLGASGPGYVDFVTEPAGAEVQLDGRNLGVTPATFALPSGVHEFEVRKPGYHPSQVTVRVSREEHVPVDLPLVPVAERP